MNVENIVREGTVTAVDSERQTARVWFDALKMGSDWMPVLVQQAVIPDHPYDKAQWTEFTTEDQEPPEGALAYAAHRHKLRIRPWLPKVGDRVLVLYFPVFNGDGVILGGVRPWQ